MKYLIIFLLLCVIGCAGTDLVYDLDNNGVLSTPEQVAAGANIAADTLTDSGIPYLELAGGVLGLGLSIFGVRRYKKNTAVLNGMSQMINIAKDNMNAEQRAVVSEAFKAFIKEKKIEKEVIKIKERNRKKENTNVNRK